MIIAFVIIGYGILFIIDGYPVLREYTFQKSISYILMFAAAFTLSLLTALNVKIPNPSEGIRKIIIMIIGEWIK
ncbi:hypothetical protein NBE98_00785 [Clostridium swellfunianum]|uniref:hypothetical protein n=1 Tax=Clostridium swellfunianum TaxID=1367462 RepID=UPI002030E73F|nr:hypothetical protein [Clostridium swellfunianum]MCM0646906.1 hypothetical protein [Clostridium swellfunianum]